MRSGLAVAFPAELDGHFVFAVAQRTRADHFAHLRAVGVAVADDFDFAVLSDGERFFQQKRNPAKGEVARHDLEGGIGVGAVEDSEDGLALNGAAIFAASVSVLLRGRRRRWPLPLRGRGYRVWYLTHRMRVG